MKLVLYLFCFITLCVSCKKVPYYAVSDSEKAYFAFQKGSYWIYKDDSTGVVDSTYVFMYDDNKILISDSRVRIEFVSSYFKSKFLSAFELGYTVCAGPDYFQLTSKLNPLIDSSTVEIDGPVAFYPGWPQNTKIISNDCIPNYYFYYKLIPSDTINNVIYKNLIYSKFQSIDSSSTNPIFYLREVYFAKNVGLVKYFEINRYSNIHRRLSLLRERVIQ
ncbi:MAG: hypothetical protein ABSD71_08055 [Bacteroidales bacterium]|jgi:hypothetical protein